MNILNVLNYSPEFGGGISKHLAALAKIALEKNHKLFIAFPKKREWQDKLRQNAEIIIVPEILHPLRSRFPKIIKKICNDNSINVLHTHFTFAQLFSLALSPKKWRIQIPTIHHWHNPPVGLNEYLTSKSSIKGNLIRYFSGLVARFTDYRVINMHISISKEISNLLLKNKWTIENKIRLIPNGNVYESVKIRKKNKGSTEFIIGTIANFRQQKDHETLIKAFGLLRNEVRNVELWIVGDGPTRSSMETLARKLKISSHIKFLGTVLNPTEIIDQFDIFVLSTNYEGHPLVLLEAMSYSLPIVATRISSIPEVIEDGVNGLLVNPKDPIDLTKVILSIIQNKALYQKLSEQSALSYNNQLTLDQWAAKVISIYENLFG